ncbi:hypothetical protein F2P81_001803 [Scophthalmus maximus]|uniref:Uncharacterized protein n=1 Tax=Scophthalmus maximus TaxID=52904 RepID=A0A6A4TPX7_SCOMX|nr:hypothetical protein F2P81_001803 [Scophthalmus maximus]
MSAHTEARSQRPDSIRPVAAECSLLRGQAVAAATGTSRHGHDYDIMTHAAYVDEIFSPKRKWHLSYDPIIQHNGKS